MRLRVGVVGAVGSRGQIGAGRVRWDGSRCHIGGCQGVVPDRSMGQRSYPGGTPIWDGTSDMHGVPDRDGVPDIDGALDSRWDIR